MMQTTPTAVHDPLAGLHDTMRQALAPFFNVQAQRREAYTRALRAHDWTSQFSDSADVARRGRATLAALKQMQRELDPDFEVWNALCPRICRDGREFS